MHRCGCRRVFPSHSSKLREGSGRVCHAEEANFGRANTNGGIVCGVNILGGKVLAANISRGREPLTRRNVSPSSQSPENTYRDSQHSGIKQPYFQYIAPHHWPVCHPYTTRPATYQAPN